jgi:flagellar hook-basal body complex protein FliE
MSMPISSATAAYSQAQRLIDQSAKPNVAPTPEPTSGPGFSDVLSQNMNAVVEAGKVADEKSLQMINGDANVVDVVTAIAETEIAVESMVAIRDRVIQAYEEIMRMPI